MLFYIGEYNGNYTPNDILIKPKKSNINLNCKTFFIEDIDKTDQYLDILEYKKKATKIIVAGITRYCINSKKINRLQQLTSNIDVDVIDTTLFKKEKHNIYIPFSLINREILGYNHIYAFLGNYQEVYDNKIYNSLDNELIAKKIKGSVVFNYTLPKIKKINVIKNIDKSYQELKEKIFSTDNFNSKTAITKLADFANETVPNEFHKIDACFIVNIKNKEHKKLSEVQTYSNFKGTEKKHIIFLEPIITHSFGFHEILYACRNADKIELVIDDTNVNNYLSNLMLQELKEVAKLCEYIKK